MRRRTGNVSSRMRTPSTSGYLVGVRSERRSATAEERPLIRSQIGSQQSCATEGDTARCNLTKRAYLCRASNSLRMMDRLLCALALSTVGLRSASQRNHLGPRLLILVPTGTGLQQRERRRQQRRPYDRRLSGLRQTATCGVSPWRAATTTPSHSAVEQHGKI